MTIHKMVLFFLPLLATAVRPAEGADECVFPGTAWEQTTPESQGIDSAKLLGTYSRSGYNNNDLFVIPAWNMVTVRRGPDSLGEAASRGRRGLDRAAREGFRVPGSR